MLKALAILASNPLIAQHLICLKLAKDFETHQVAILGFKA